MFTGLVQATGTVRRIDAAPAGMRLEVSAPGWRHGAAVGDSISVSGCCLTAASIGEDGALAFDVIPETLEKTSLGGLRPGSRVNLETSCRVDTLLGGHLVQGHVDGVGLVTRVDADESDWRIEVEPPDALMEFATPKGSISIEGVSLTLARVAPERGRIGVALIPTTLALTTLGELREGSRVNLEMDVVAKTIIHWARHYGPDAGGAGPTASR